MKLAANLAALTALTLATAGLSAQEAAAPKPATAATGSTSAKPKPRPLSIDEVEKIQAARLAAARAAALKPAPAKAATGSTGSTAATKPAIAKAAPASTGKTASIGSTGPATTKPAPIKSVSEQSFPVTYVDGKPVPIKLPPAPKPQTAPKPTTTTTATPLTSLPKPAAPKPVAPAPPKPVVPAVQKPVAPVTPKPAPASTAPPVLPAVPTTGPLNRTTIVLDPSHGGNDNGSRLSDNLVEKDVTLTFAFKLRSLLQARGFTVVLTRDADPTTSDNNPAPLTLDDRAGIANHSRAVACLLLHATAAGSGVHLYHSELDPAQGEAPSLPWLTAQAAWVPQSTTLAAKLSQSLTRASIPLVSSAASIRPVDSLTCPALVIELAPKDGDISSLTDSSYQQSVAEAIAGALVFWKNQAQPPTKLVTPGTEAAQ